MYKLAYMLTTVYHVVLSSNYFDIGYAQNGYL